MILQEIINELGLEILTGQNALNREISGGYASDLLSDVMANSQAGNIWVTLQIHLNIIAVATLKELAAIIIVQSREPEKQAIDRAIKEDVCLLSTSMHTFEVVGKLYEMGIVGSH